MDLSKDYYFQRKLRKIMNTAPEVRAIPNTEGVVAAHVSGKAAESTRAGAKSAGRSLRKRKLAEIVRQNTAMRGLRYDALNIAKSNRETMRDLGRKATWIEIANIAGTGMAGYQKHQKQKKQEQQLGELMASNERLLEIKRNYYNKLLQQD